jgi:hypothetical protein
MQINTKAARAIASRARAKRAATTRTKESAPVAVYK